MAGQLISQIAQVLAYGRLPFSWTANVYHRVSVVIHYSFTQSIHYFPQFTACIGTAPGYDDDICLAIWLLKLFTMNVFHHYDTRVENVKVFYDLGLIGQKVIQLLIACDVHHLGHVGALSKLSIKGNSRLALLCCINRDCTL